MGIFSRNKSTDLRDLTDEALMDAWTEEAERLEVAKRVVKDYAAEFARRQSEAKARQTLASLSDEDRATLRQVMFAEGIESQEQVNG